MKRYVNRFLQYRLHYMDYPVQVHIETITVCNCRCKFCVYPNVRRIGTKMSPLMFEKIIHDLKQIPQSHKYSVVPYKINDPLMDDSIFIKLKLINTEIPNANIIFSTNGLLLNDDVISKLNEINNFAFIWVSLNGYDRESYRRIMGVDRFDKVVDNIHKLKANFNVKKLIRIGRVYNNTPDDLAFSQFVEREFGRQEWLAANPQGDFLGNVEMASGEKPEIPCLHWFEISITSTGEVALCCMDGDCKYPIGDVSRQRVLEIYNQPIYRQLREKGFIRKVVNPCNKCTFI